MWSDFEAKYGKGQPDFLDSHLHPNQELVTVLDSIMSTDGEVKDQDEAAASLPEGLTFKMALLGRAFAGKKTLASQLVKNLGPGV